LYKVQKFIVDCLQYVRAKRWCDETWVHHYMPESKWWLVHWMHESSPSLKNSSACRDIACVFWDRQWVVLV